jgi:DNA polymerase III epsilon subunit-like protein
MGVWQDMPAVEAEITALDFETTGSVPGWPVEPWQLGLVRLRGGRVIAESRASLLLRIDAGRPFNPHAPGRHAHLRDALACAPALAEHWRGLIEAWLAGRPLAAHNVGTERTVLRRTAPLHPLGPWIDTLALTRLAYPGLSDYGLDAVIGDLGLEGRLRTVSPQGEAHDAGHDACACAVLLEHLLALPRWERVTLGALAVPAGRRAVR